MKWIVLIAALCLSSISFADDTPKSISIQLQEGQHSEPIDIKEFAWLSGAWEGTGLGGNCVETWSKPISGAIVGSFLYSKNDKVIFSEHFVLSKTGESVTLKLKHFDDAFKGWEEKDKSVEFKFVKRDGNRFYFNGLTYIRNSDTSMDAYVLIKNDAGAINEVKFEFKRTH